MHWEDNPSQFEQDIAYEYCVHRPLYRPNVTYVKVGLKWLLFTVGVVAVIRGCQFILGLETVKNWFFGVWPGLESVWQAITSLKLLLIVLVVAWLFALRWFLIDCVKLYQHYASEEVRRRCIMMPTCSEFAILSLRRYGLIGGLVLTYIRVFKRCRGNIYRIEYPSLKH